MSRPSSLPLVIIPRAGRSVLCTVEADRIVEIDPVPAEPLSPYTIDESGWIAFLADEGRAIVCAHRDARPGEPNSFALGLPKECRGQALAFHRQVLYVGGGGGREILGLFDFNQSAPQWQPMDIPPEVMQHGKSIDALLIDGNRLIAVDNVILPKWLLVYDVAAPGRPRLSGQHPIPSHGVWEHVFAAGLGPHRLAVLSRTGSDAESGNHIALFDRVTLDEVGVAASCGRGERGSGKADIPIWHDVAWLGDALLIAAGDHGVGILTPDAAAPRYHPLPEGKSHPVVRVLVAPGTRIALAVVMVGNRPDAVLLGDVVADVSRMREDRAANLRRHAARARQPGSQAAISLSVLLQAALRDREAHQEARLALAEIEIDPRIAVPIVLRTLETQQVVADAEEWAAGLTFAWPAGANPGPVLVALEEGLRRGNAAVQRWAAHSLGACGPAALPILLHAARAANSEIRRGAVAALPGCAEGEDVETVFSTLAETLADEAPSVRCEAVVALQRFGPIDETAAVLTAMLADPEPVVRCAAVRAVGEFAPRRADVVPLLVDRIADSHPDVRQAAFAVLQAARVEAELPLSTLILLLDDDCLRDFAAGVLEQMGPDANAALPRLVALLLRGKAGAGVVFAFRAIAGGNGVVLLLEALRQEWYDHRVCAAQLANLVDPGDDAEVPLLVEALQDPREDVRIVAAAMLGRIGPAAAGAVPLLEEMAREKDADLRSAGQSALEQICGVVEE